MNCVNFHKDFHLNGISFTSKDELLAYSKNKLPSLYGFLVIWFNNNDSILVQTSGSTGTPKSIQLKKEHMKNSALATGTFFNLSEKTTALLCLSINYIAGKMMVVRALTLGWKLDVVEPTSKVPIEKEYDFSAMVPIQLQKSKAKIYKIRKLIVGGGIVSNKLVEEIQHIKTQVFATYGMTETITHIAIRKLNNFVEGESILNSYYKCISNVVIGHDNRNCLVINAPKISDEWIITNDVVQLISENEFEWLGRYDNVINSGGIKLHPEKIEEKLATIIEDRFFVAGIPDTILGEKLILVVEKEKSKLLATVKTAFENQIFKLKSLNKYEKPKEIYFLERFIVTPTEKIQREKTLQNIMK